MTAPTPPTEEPRDDDLASEPEFGHVSPDTLTLIEGATSHSFSGLSRAFAVTFEDEPDELEALRDRQDILTLAQHCKTYADGDVYLAAARVLHLFRTADPFAAYERVVAERDEARAQHKIALDVLAGTEDDCAVVEAENARLRSDLNQATLSTDHTYLSTACLHAAEPGREALHRECQVDIRRYDGSHKQGATCKFCPAQCVCTCHSAVCADVDEAGETDA